MTPQRLWHLILGRLPRGRRRVPGRPRRHPLRLEGLEDRVVPTNWFVSTAGSDVPGGGAPAAPFRSVQYAVNVAQSGDRIHVAGGVYGYNPAADQLSGPLGVKAVLEIYDKQLQLFGGFDNGFTTRSASTPTFIDGGGALRGVFVLANAVDVSLLMDGFTVRYGVAHGEAALQGNDRKFAFGGGMWVNSAARPNADAPVTLSNVTFLNNNATGAGGDGDGGGLALRYVKNVRLENVTFVGNVSKGDVFGDGLGGGLQADHSNITGYGVTFANNRALGQYEAWGGGGAAAIQFASTVSWQHVTATGNQADALTNGGPEQGGAFFVESAALMLTDAAVRNNLVKGGDIGSSLGYTSGRPSGSAGGGGIAVLNDTAGLNARLALDRVQLVGNHALSGSGSSTGPGDADGGGVFVTATTGQAPTTITNSLITDNVAELGQYASVSGRDSFGGGGGGLWLQGVTADIAQTTFANNQLISPAPDVPYFFFVPNFGTAVLLSNRGAPAPTVARIAFSIIANHTSANNPAPAVEALPGDAAGRDVIHYARSLYANNTQDDNSATAPSAFTGLDTMLHARAAGFVSAGAPNEDYRLAASSPAIDAAAGSSATVDLNLFPRDGRPDLGAYEFGSVPWTPARAASSPGTFDPTTAVWYLRNEDDPGAPDLAPFAYAAPGWIPLVGDWDGNGTQTIGVFDPATATWYLKNSNTPGVPDIKPFRYGGPGWKPVVGDWNGSGKWGIGVVDPNGVWYLRNEASAGAPDYKPFAYGAGAWTPVAGAWGGGGRSGIGMFDPATGTWYLRNEASAGAPDAGQFAFGGPGWRPVVGDWDGGGRVTVGAVDPGGNWYERASNTPDGPDIGPFAYGAGNWTALAGDYDG